MSAAGDERTNHPIGVAAERAGVSPDVIRVWERRYGVVDPHRDAGGRRVYTSADIERLRLLARATAGGRSIGQVAELDPSALAELVREDEEARRRVAAAGGASPDVDLETSVELALSRTRALDPAGLQNVLLRAASLNGVPLFLRGVLVPLFRAIGDGWHDGAISTSQEHLASAAARSVLARVLGGLPSAPDGPGLVVATPAGERHEIGALLAAAEATAVGWRVTYLGPDLPADEIARAATETGARAVALGSSYAPRPAALRREIRTLRSALPKRVVVLLGGAAFDEVEWAPAEGVHVIRNLDDLSTRLRALAEG